MRITSSEIKALTPQGMKLIFDHEFTVPEHEAVVDAVSGHMLSRGRSVETGEENDCDNRAFILFTAVMGKGWDFAFIAIPGHAICGYIDRDKKWRYFEPLDGAEIDQKIKHVVTIMS